MFIVGWLPLDKGKIVLVKIFKVESELFLSFAFVNIVSRESREQRRDEREGKGSWRLQIAAHCTPLYCIADCCPLLPPWIFALLLLLGYHNACSMVVSKNRTTQRGKMVTKIPLFGTESEFV
jgi:hypothetical protein